MQTWIAILFWVGVALVGFPVWRRLVMFWLTHLEPMAIASRDEALSRSASWERRMHAAFYWIGDHPTHVVVTGLLVWAMDLLLVVVSL